MDTNLILQYLAVLLLVCFALWRMIAGIRKKRRSIKNGGGCCGCSLASSCKDYNKPAQETRKSVAPDKSCCGVEQKKDCCR